MWSVLRNLSIQTQINAALGVVGLFCAISLGVALKNAESISATFSELSTKRAPAIFSAFEANESLNRLNAGFDHLSLVGAPEDVAVAQREINAATKTLRENLLQINQGAERASAQKSLDAIASARSEAVSAAEARLKAAAERDALWSRTESLQKEVASKLVSYADEATFDLVIRAEDAKSRLKDGLATLLNQDVENLSQLMRLRAVLAELEGVFYTLDVVSDSAGARAAATDRLESALGRLRVLIGEASGLSADQVAEIKALEAMAAEATAADQVSDFVAAGGVAKAVALKKRIAKAVTDHIDEATFGLVLAGEELSEATQSEVERLASATTGEYRATLDAAALAQSVTSRVAQALNAHSVEKLGLVRQATSTLIAQVESAASNAALEKFQDDFRALGALISEDGVFAVRQRQLAAAAATEASKEQARVARGAIGGLVNSAVSEQRGLMRDAMSTAEEKASTARDLQILAGAATLLTVLLVAVAFIRPRIVKPLRAFREAVAMLARGEPVELPWASRGDEIGALARSMGAIYDSGLAAARIRISLDNSSALLMVADAENRVSYVSERLSQLLAENSEALSREIAEWDPAQLIGSDLARFDVGGDLQGLHGRKSGVERGELALAGRQFALVMSPVASSTGERLGTVVEWRDATAEIRATGEIDRVVSAALQGDFSQKATLDDAPRLLKEMGEKLNKVAETVNASVSETNRVMKALAEGDLTDDMNGEFHGVFAELQRNVNQTVAHLAQLIGEISRTAETVGQDASDITSGAENLSSRAEQQASSLEQAAATMEEMSTSVKGNAESSSGAQTLAADASGRAKAGGAVVNDAVAAMGEIEAGAAKIGSIISVIDAIAFQTNLLALNAAVEAARAGEAGKGFAVVASEVRALAQRSSDAAQDIRGVIETSAAQVSEGVRLVTETGDALDGIVASIAQVEETMHEIADASREQASSVEEISSTVSHLDHLTQENASLVEESASNARSLSGSAHHLRELIAFFKVASGGSETVIDGAWREAEAAQPRTDHSSENAAAAASNSAPAAVEPAERGGGAWAEF